MKDIIFLNLGGHPTNLGGLPQIKYEKFHIWGVPPNEPLQYCRHRCNLDFIIICFGIFLRRRCPGQSFKVEGLKFGIKVGSDSLICTWGYDF